MTAFAVETGFCQDLQPKWRSAKNMAFPKLEIEVLAPGDTAYLQFKV